MLRETGIPLGPGTSSEREKIGTATWGSREDRRGVRRKNEGVTSHGKVV